MSNLAFAALGRAIDGFVATCDMADKVVRNVPVVRTLRGTIIDTLLGPEDAFEYESRTSAKRS